jgi:hypothetical protein
MSIRYEPTSSDPRELKRERAAKDRVWQREAEQLLKDRPEFFRWRKLHRAQFFCWALAAGGLAGWGLYWLYGPKVLRSELLLWPIAAFASIWGLGELIYSKRCRKIVLQHWSDERKTQREKSA